MGQICFSEFLKIISSYFAQNFCTYRVDILLRSATNEKGGQNLAPLPPRSIVDVGDKHAHDSDHAECYIVPYIASKVEAFLQDLMFDITNILNLAMLLEWLYDLFLPDCDKTTCCI